MELCVIFNPVAARGRARSRLDKLRRRLGARAEFWATQRAGHAEALAFAAARSGFTTVAAAGGDGTVHEVANGLLRADRPEVRFAVFPLGSANDYYHSLTHALDPRPGAASPDGVRPVDVGLVRGDNGRERYFVNTLGLGFNSAVTLESRRIPYLQGMALYGLGLLLALGRRFARPWMTIAFDEETREGPTLALSVAVGRREGSFVVAPDAQMDDGLFDYLQAGALARWEVIRFLPTLASGKPFPENYPQVWTGRCREVRLSCEAPLAVHLDGEFFCLPRDNVHRLEIRLLPGRLRVQTVTP